MAGISVKLPLTADEQDGHYRLNKTYEEMVNQNLKMLILCSPGEKPMDPLYGVGIRRFLFEQNTPAVHQEIQAKILEQVSKYLPYVEIDQILFDSIRNAYTQEVENMLRVSIYYTILPLDTQDTLAINIDLGTS